MKQRLQKILSSRGVASRRKSEELLLSGRIQVNGEISALGDSADPDLDEILLDGRPLPSKSEYMYIMLNKPRGFVTTLSDEKGRPNAAQLVADCGVRVYPVGRLDMDSEGLLIFTNDGEFANCLMHPKHEVEKTYDTWVTGYSEEGFLRLMRPMTLDGYAIRKPKAERVKIDGEKALLRITIHEGRNRQVRRMCQTAGMHVTRLRRIREGAVFLGDLPKGKWRHLTEDEVRKLKT